MPSRELDTSTASPNMKTDNENHRALPVKALLGDFFD
nr:MAG TPA: hypothetical protein [Caudoviricetes sp.]